MRILGIVCGLSAIFLSFAGCKTTRLSRIQPGMTRTDVAVELGKPVDIFNDGETAYWVYPASEKEVCRIRFINQKVDTETMKCENSENTRELATRAAKYLSSVNSEVEYQNRILRFCGRRPEPQKGCKISDHCVNGGWEEICESSPKGEQ
jgi:outer membrane protein assembly factor BamE (lipoprotein component of BamABCDE complex)